MTRKAMKKVITYGTYDLLHYGHVRLLERAKALGDYLIVGVTSDDFDKSRGKINVQQPLTERIEGVRKTGLADQILVEEYEGQKIDDIRRLGVDIFTVGSDWVGKFDYLNAFCNVVYLDRTKGISSTQLRSDHAALRMGVVGDSAYLRKVRDEAAFVNGLEITAIMTHNCALREEFEAAGVKGADSEEELFEACDAVYIRSDCARHAALVREALQAGCHVLCESPLTLSEHESEELFALAEARSLILMEALKTAFSTAFSRMVLLIQAGKIGDVVSVDAVCTSMQHRDEAFEWPCIYEWGPTALLPIFQILGARYERCSIVSRDFVGRGRDGFAKMDFLYPHATASARVGNAVKSEGDLVVTGTKGYIYVPAPWWKTDYFEVRYENPADNRRYFYALEGEGIRNELVSFVKAIEMGRPTAGRIERDVTLAIGNIMRQYAGGNKLVLGSSRQ